MQASGMNSSYPRYAAKAALFFAPLLVVLLLLEAGTRRVGTLHRSRARVFAQASPALVLVTGNSHETVGVICKDLRAPCAKLAAGSQSVLLDALLLRRYRDAFPHVKVLLIGVSYYSFEYALEDEEEWRMFEYFHAYGIDGERVRLPLTDVRRYSLAATYGLGTSLGWGLRGFPVELPAARADLAGDVDVGALVQRERSHGALVRRIAKHEKSLRPELIPETTAALASMIDWARAHGAQPVLLVSPVTRDYAAAADVKTIASMRSIVAKLADHGAARVADYLTDTRFGDDEFYDFDHLTHEGAAHFTSILQAEVIDSIVRP
jgi:hypothetical protein